MVYNSKTYLPIDRIEMQWRKERPDFDLNIQKFLLQIYLYRAGHLVDAHFKRMCIGQFGIRSQDMRLLFALRRHGAPFSMRPTALYQSLLVTSGAITKEVNRLEKLKLVRRVFDPARRRGFLVQLTDHGLVTADRAATMVSQNQSMDTPLAALTNDQRALTLQFCVQIINAFQEFTPTP